MFNTWDDVLHPPEQGNRFAELFHENTKIGRHDEFSGMATVARRMREMHEALPYATSPSVALPTDLPPLDRPLGDTLLSRVTAHDLTPVPLTLATVATLLHHAYGITRSNEGTQWPRPFRAAPSGGALYPLELFVHSRCVEGLTPGLHHFNPVDRCLRLLREGDLSREIAGTFVPFQADVAYKVSALFFLTAVFERSTFKYGARGYRFILLEAGHVAQNLNLAATGLGLGCINIGGFFDREVDRLIGIDGVSHSSLYMVGVGGRTGEPAAKP